MIGGLRLFLLELHLHGVEALAVDAVDVALGDECVGIDCFHDTENSDRLDLAAPDHEDFHLLLGIPSHAVHHRHAAMGLLVDLVGDFLPTMGEDGELRGLAVTVDDHIGDICYHECDDPAVDNQRHTGVEACPPVTFEGEEDAACHDKHVGDDHRAADRDVAELRDHGGHDISAAGGAVVDEDGAYAQTAEHTAEDGAHADVGYDGVAEAHEEILEHSDEQRDDGSAEYRAHHEGLSDELEGEAEQHEVAGILRDGYGDEAVGAEIDECADTRQSADHYLMRQDKRREPDAVKHQAEDNHDVVFGIAQKGSF